ncbi:hypothetical protein BJ508DRAFT_327510 [Ascobolus immersus RN42]|uniref:Uncharacterized protein n=1 Tax=Ascobolus immersus RN42 TaxID=1160509 RepID=A0A3N4I2H7_ASCIM|nr:hypothetical protein BJ508DRAFT_327510 [Ascobolus immersus RN42]
MTLLIKGNLDDPSGLQANTASLYAKIHGFSATILDRKDGHDGEAKRHIIVLRACILHQSLTITPPYDVIDNRFFYLDENGFVTATCPIAIRVALKVIRDYNPSSITMDDYAKTIANFCNNPSIIGFTVEAAVLAHVAKWGIPGLDLGAKKKDYFGGTPRVRYFESDWPTIDLETEGATLYLPSRYNNGAIDALLVFVTKPARSGAKILVHLMPIQITLSVQWHSDSETAFFLLFIPIVEAWSSAYNVEFTFAWIGPTSNEVSPVRKNSLRSGVAHPSFARLHLDFGDINPKINEGLEAINYFGGKKRRTTRTATRPTRSFTTNTPSTRVSLSTASAHQALASPQSASSPSSPLSSAPSQSPSPPTSKGVSQTAGSKRDAADITGGGVDRSGSKKKSKKNGLGSSTE